MKKLIMLPIVFLFCSCNANFFYIEKTICVHGNAGEIITSGSRVEDVLKGVNQEAKSAIKIPMK